MVRVRRQYAYNFPLRDRVWDITYGGINADNADIGTGTNRDSSMDDFKDVPGIAIQSLLSDKAGVGARLQPAPSRMILGRGVICYDLGVPLTG